MLNQEQFRGKWKEIKGGVRNLWGKITEDELEKTKGNLGAIAGMVESKYGETKESIKEKIDRLMASFDNETDKINLSETSFERKPTAIRTSEKSQVQDGIQDIKTRSPERSVYDRKVANSATDEFNEEDDQDFDADTEESHQNYEAQKPVSKPHIKDFDSDRNARH